MEFTIKKFDLLREVALTQGVVEKKTTIPILANLLMEASGARLNIAATDLDTGIRTSCPAEVKKEGAITTPAKNFLEIVRNLPDAEIKVKKLENNYIQLVCGSSSFKLVGLPRDNFPALPEPAKMLVEVPARVLQTLINRTIFAIAGEESRYTLNGALLLLRPLSVTMVTTDGHRLAHIEKQQNLEHLDSEVRALVPKKALAELQRLFSEARDEEMVSFGKDETHLFFQMGGRLMFSRMLTGQFPNYEAVLPRERHTSILLDREELASAIKRVALMADDKSRAVKLGIEKDRLEITASNADLGEAREEIETHYSAGPFQISFNCHYLLDFLSAIADEKISIEFKDEQSAGQMRPAAEEEFYYRYIVMPMRI
ncbi:MAG: DNA polymerase III subunit beta [Acidobacteriota bacterium]